MTTDLPPPGAVRLAAVTKRYGSGAQAVTALDAVTLGFAAGTFTAVMGPSGSGKSTLLHCAAGLERPTGGEVTIGGVALTGLRESALARLRREQVGFVFQSFNLVAALTAEQNVALPLRLAGHRPVELSGGQQQRVALARALITRPAVIFADEPTGALDSRTSREVLELLRALVDRHGQTVVMVTHDPVCAGYADRVVLLADGRLVDELAGDLSAQRITARMSRLESTC
ncbi:MAG TPA: ABC transporter ATP-binding protein [Pilimelia sp.]|nr:ABC transporter ATP-binding protein [Pilimelia sp.]